MKNNEERLKIAQRAKLTPATLNDVHRIPINNLCTLFNCNPITLHFMMDDPDFLLCSATFTRMYGQRHTRINRDLLSFIELGNYVRLRNYWVTPQVNGKNLPRIRNQTIDRFMVNGLVRYRKDGVTLMLTEKGKKVYYNGR